MESINSRPRPRLLVIDKQGDEAEARARFTNFPTLELIKGKQDIYFVDQSEYDVAVVVGESLTDIKLNRNLIVLHVGTSGTLSDTRFENLDYKLSVRGGLSVARELAIPSELESGLKQLITKTLLPIYQGELSHNILSSRVAYGANIRSSDKLWLPLVTDLRGTILAGHYGIKNGGEHWWLPRGLDYVAISEWLNLLSQQWSVDYPERFPDADEEWQVAPEWMTKQEKDVRAEITKAESDLQDYIAKQASLVNEKEKAFAIAKENADKGVRQLLTEQGDVLKNTVKSVLEDMGFTVEDADKEHAEKGDLLEDLRLKFKSEDPQVLIEVRGYKKGAKLSDLLRLSRFEKRYMKDKGGQEPRALWYVVNHDFSAHPSKRTMALAEHPNEVEEFSKTNGLVIDTVEFFRLVQSVELDELTKVEARNRLLEAKGTFKVVAAQNKPRSEYDA